jgi:hypothetical protein
MTQSEFFSFKSRGIKVHLVFCLFYVIALILQTNADTAAKKIAVEPWKGVLFACNSLMFVELSYLLICGFS